jgi:hypothetical protein
MATDSEANGNGNRKANGTGKRKANGNGKRLQFLCA